MKARSLILTILFVVVLVFLAIYASSTTQPNASNVDQGLTDLQ